MTTEPQDTDARVNDLVHYICTKCVGDPDFDIVKLYGIMFFSDFKAYVDLGKPITGAEYRKYRYGAVPGRGSVVCTSDCGHTASHQFSEAEIAIVDSVIARVYGWTSVAVSGHVLLRRGWQLAAMDEPIPYFTALLENKSKPLSGEALTWAQRAAAKHAADAQTVRVVRVVEYVGRRDVVEKTIRDSIAGAISPKMGLTIATARLDLAPALDATLTAALDDTRDRFRRYIDIGAKAYEKLGWRVPEIPTGIVTVASYVHAALAYDSAPFSWRHDFRPSEWPAFRDVVRALTDAAEWQPRPATCGSCPALAAGGVCHDGRLPLGCALAAAGSIE